MSRQDKRHSKNKHTDILNIPSEPLNLNTKHAIKAEATSKPIHHFPFTKIASKE